MARRRSKKHGYDFEREVSASLKLIEESVSQFWFMKLVDTHSFDKIKVVFEGKQSPEKLIVPKVPADYLIISRGKPIFIECKSTKMERWDPVQAIAPHQLDASLLLERAGAKYFFAVCDRRKPRKHRMLIFSGKTMRMVCSILEKRKKNPTKKKGDSTFTWDELDKYALEIQEKQSGCMWNMEFVVEKE